MKFNQKISRHSWQNLCEIFNFNLVNGKLGEYTMKTPWSILINNLNNSGMSPPLNSNMNSNMNSNQLSGFSF